MSYLPNIQTKGVSGFTLDVSEKFSHAFILIGWIWLKIETMFIDYYLPFSQVLLKLFQIKIWLAETRFKWRIVLIMVTKYTEKLSSGFWKQNLINLILNSNYIYNF